MVRRLSKGASGGWGGFYSGQTLSDLGALQTGDQQHSNRGGGRGGYVNTLYRWLYFANLSAHFFCVSQNIIDYHCSNFSLSLSTITVCLSAYLSTIPWSWRPVIWGEAGWGRGLSNRDVVNGLCVFEHKQQVKTLKMADIAILFLPRVPLLGASWRHHAISEGYRNTTSPRVCVISRQDQAISEGVDRNTMSSSV